MQFDFHPILRRYFELAQDFIVAALCVVLFAVMVHAIWILGRLALVEHQDVSVVLSQIVLLLVLVELFRTLIFYLSEHRVSVSLMLEVAIVAELREILLNPPTGINDRQTLSNAALLLVLGGLLIADRYLLRRRLLHQNEVEDAATA